jgi:HEAT repeat protein
MTTPDDIEYLLDRLDQLLHAAVEIPPAPKRPVEPPMDRTKRRAPALGSQPRGTCSGQEPALSAGRTIPLALEALRVPDTRDLALHSLVKLGDTAIPSLLGLLHDQDHHLRQSAAWGISRIRDRGILHKLVRAAHWTFHYVSHPEDPHAVPALLEALAVGSRPTRLGVAVALGRLAEQGVSRPRVLPELLELLNDPYPLARIGAAWALGRLGAAAAAPYLAMALYDIDALVGRIAAESLARIGSADALAAVEAWRGNGSLQP